MRSPWRRKTVAWSRGVRESPLVLLDSALRTRIGREAGSRRARLVGARNRCEFRHPITEPRSLGRRRDCSSIWPLRALRRLGMPGRPLIWQRLRRPDATSLTRSSVKLPDSRLLCPQRGRNQKRQYDQKLTESRQHDRMQNPSAQPENRMARSGYRPVRPCGSC